MEYAALSVSVAASLLGAAAFLSFDLKRIARALERLADGQEA